MLPDYMMAVWQREIQTSQGARMPSAAVFQQSSIQVTLPQRI